MHMLSTQRWMVAVVGSLVLSWSSLGMAQGLPDFTELVEEVSPAVVNISTSQKAPVARSLLQVLMPFLFGRPIGVSCRPSWLVPILVPTWRC